MPERRLDLLAPRTLRRRPGGWAGRLAGPPAIRATVAEAGWRLARWRPRITTGRAVFPLRLEPLVLRRLPGVLASRTVRLQRCVHETRLVSVRLPGPIPPARIEAPVAVAAAVPPPRRDPAPAAGTPPARPAAQTRLVCRTVQNRVESRHLIMTRHVVQAGATTRRSAPPATAPVRSRRRPGPMVVHAARSRPAPAGPRPAPEAEAGSRSPMPAAMPPPPVAGPVAPAVDLDVLVAQVLRRIERRALAQRERLGRG